MTTTAIKTKNDLSKRTTFKRKHWWQSAIELLLLCVLFIVLVETFFNLCGIGQEEFLEPDLKMGCRHIANKLVVWRLEGYSKDYLNSQGLRDTEHSLEKPKNTTRIALLGDSATEALQVPLAETYGKRLERLLSNSNAAYGKKNFEVINFGCSSYSTGQELLQFRNQVAAYKPDITMLLYVRGDTIENARNLQSLQDISKTEPRPYFYLDNKGQLQQDNAVLENQKSILSPNPVVDFLRRNSHIYGVLSHTNLTLSINESLYRKLRSWLTAPFKTKNKVLKNTSSNSPQAYPIQDNWQVSSAIIKELHKECKKNNSRLWVLVFPNNVYDPIYMNQMIKLQAQSKEQGFGFFDLTPGFVMHKDMNSLFLKYHFSSKGHEFIAKQLANLLQ